IVEGGFEPYLRLGDSMGTASDFPPLAQRAPTNPDNWVQAAVEVVRHYDELSRQAGIPLRYVEIWNEPNFKQFWDATPREFYDLFANTAAALKAEFPHLMIGGPGLASSGGSLTPEGEQYTQRFLDYLQQHNTPLDFFSWHVYSSDAAIYVQLATYYRQQLDAHGYTETEIHITEWNTAMQGEDETDAVRNTARGAALMTAAWIGLQEGGVAVSTFYRGNESGQHGNMGLFYADGRAKPMALAFSLWAEMAAHPQRLAVTPTGSDDPNRLWVLAGQDERGEVALLIVNPTDTPTSWEALFAGRDLAGGATLYQVDDAGDEVQVFTLTKPAAELGAYTVQLLVAEPVFPPPTSTPAVTAPYLMALLACDTATSDCYDPSHHLVYLAQSDDGLHWSLIPNWQPYQGSVPDVIRRGDTLYIYTPGRLARYHLDTNTLDPPTPVDIADLPGGFVDPSLFIDEQGRLVLFFLYGQPGSDPAGCAPGETTCVRQIGSATEVDGSDGAAFTLDAGQRVSMTVDPQSAIKTASDPDIFFDGEQYVLYLSHGASTSVWVSDELRGAYAQATSLPQGLLTLGTGGVPAGYFDPLSGQYWTFAHINRNGLLVIRRAVHGDLSRQLGESDFVTVISGESLGLGMTYSVGSPSFAVNGVEE
ncbi:MAG TPA: hypothetical protein EYH32_07515, partial [Anaerolineae bacterium]|nr:hypothetical protein [Anaerolineae bacterium]